MNYFLKFDGFICTIEYTSSFLTTINTFFLLSQLDALRETSDKMTADNSKLSASLNSLMNEHATLQTNLTTIQSELEEKQHIVESVQLAR